MTDVESFPTTTIPRDPPLHRIHRRANHPAYFSSGGDWRFDPPASHRLRYGVCYLGLAPMTAFVEVFGRQRANPRSAVDARRLSSLTPTADLVVADLTHRSVVGAFGVTAAVSTGWDYGPAQALSARLFDAGFAGVRYRVSHDPSMTLEGIGLFGPPGQHPGRFATVATEPIPEDLVEEGRSIYGIEVLADAAAG